MGVKERLDLGEWITEGVGERFRVVCDGFFPLSKNGVVAPIKV